MRATPLPRASTLTDRVTFPNGITRDDSTPDEMTTIVLLPFPPSPEVTSSGWLSTSRTRFPVSKFGMSFFEVGEFVVGGRLNLADQATRASVATVVSTVDPHPAADFRCELIHLMKESKVIILEIFLIGNAFDSCVQ